MYRATCRLVGIVSLFVMAGAVTHGQPAAVETLPQAVEGQSYRVVLPASGGTSPYRWSVEAGGAVPPGIALGPDGSLAGVAQTRGEYRFVIRLTDRLDQSVRQAVLLEVAPPQSDLRPLTLRTDRLPDAVASRGYSVTLASEGGAAPYRWTSRNPLPPGLSLTAETGTLSGTPRNAGSYNIDISVADGRGSSAPTRALRLEVLEPTVARNISERRLKEWWKFIGLAVVLAGYILIKQGINDRYYFRQRNVLHEEGLSIELNNKGTFISGPQAARDKFINLGRTDRQRIFALRCLFGVLGVGFFLGVIFL